MKSSWFVAGHDRVHLATGMVVVHGVIGEGAILTNCFTKWWSLASKHGKAHSRIYWVKVLCQDILSFSAFLYSLQIFLFDFYELNRVVTLTKTLL